MPEARITKVVGSRAQRMGQNPLETGRGGVSDPDVDDALLVLPDLPAQ
jgi:hypothetical protein